MVSAGHEKLEARMSRERQLTEAFVGLADTLGEDFDVVDLFDRLAGHCVTLTGADAAGIMISDGRGRSRRPPRRRRWSSSCRCRPAAARACGAT